MNNGCICCTVRGELIRIVGQLVKRKGQLDGIIIETTGLADPSPVAQTFFMDDQVKARSRLDAIVTVVDAKHLLARLEDSHEAEEQVAFADVVVLNKTDLVTPDELDGVEARIRSINRSARVLRAEKANVPLAELMDRGSFDLSRILEMEPDFLSGEDDHEHDDAVTSVSLILDAPLDMQRFNQWIGTLLMERGQDLLRTEGILHFADDDQRIAFHGRLAIGVRAGSCSSVVTSTGRNCAAASRLAQRVQEGGDPSSPPSHAARSDYRQQPLVKGKLPWRPRGTALRCSISGRRYAGDAAAG